MSCKNYATVYEFTVKTEGVCIHGDITFMVPTNPATATRLAINKAEFIASCTGAPWDGNNLSVTLIRE